MRRVPELDSLRGLAALAIVAFHLDPPAFYAGWTGVDLFFVLSGYLITGIILRHGDSAGFLVNFYARRGLRIWPIYYLCLLALVAINPLLPRPESLASLPYYLTYTQNLPLYWRGSAPTMPSFDHTWTLALEEQFYLLWPALVLLVGPRRIVPLCLGAVALAWMAREDGWLAWGHFYERLLLARCDGFALGGLLAAMALRHDPRRVSQASAGALVVGLGYLVWGIVAMGSGVQFLGLPTPARPSTTILAVGLMYAGLVGLVAMNAGARPLVVLRGRPLAYLGQISYGIYLYHIPIFWLIDGQRFVSDQSWTIRAEKVGLTLLAAVASWHLIESPVLRLKDRFSYRSA